MATPHRPTFLKRVELLGLRGFGREQALDLAIPNGQPGSGLTLLVGPNNGGKSTIIEALHFLQRVDVPPSFGPARKNAHARGAVQIRYFGDNGQSATLGNDPRGGGDVAWRENEFGDNRPKPFVVPARRILTEAPFQNAPANRIAFAGAMMPGDIRAGYRGAFGARLSRMHANQAAVQTILQRVVDEVPAWHIEPTGEQGMFGLRVYGEGGVHGGDGIGDGLISLLFLADALYDSGSGDVIVLDEPELSLHPASQRRLADVLNEFAADRQIVLATHSAYLATWQAIFNGAVIARVFRQESATRIAQLGNEAVDAVRGLIRDYGNPHVLGLESREVFFLHDGVILVEGQEDVVAYNIIAEQLGRSLPGSFYGWGVGGASNMKLVCPILRDLGFRRVVGLLDANQAKLADDLHQRFPDFTFLVAADNDVRTKPARAAQEAKPGLLDERWRLTTDAYPRAEALFGRVAQALSNRLAAR